MKGFAVVLVAALAAISLGQSSAPKADWAMNATVIESCSCPVFCPCQFGSITLRHWLCDSVSDRSGLLRECTDCTRAAATREPRS